LRFSARQSGHSATDSVRSGTCSLVVAAAIYITVAP
jgi:hypothetical protein